ncbi:MAG: DNA helicase RecG, partial [Actinomycetota bacterium]
LRGEGTLMNTAQKGRSDLKLASLRRDRELVELGRSVAFELVEADPLLQRNPLLLDEVRLLFTDDDEAFLFKS